MYIVTDSGNMHVKLVACNLKIYPLRCACKVHKILHKIGKYSVCVDQLMMSDHSAVMCT
jgi:hypothetical protein